ncbi:hypothetical protein BS17DRAFT_382319 [Gyrodon lividus]|nr:hypothetical protein BS17DRAFT_382319 [Gyrodon lividus]
MKARNLFPFVCLTQLPLSLSPPACRCTYGDPASQNPASFLRSLSGSPNFSFDPSLANVCTECLTTLKTCPMELGVPTIQNSCSLQVVHIPKQHHQNLLHRPLTDLHRATSTNVKCEKAAFVSKGPIRFIMIQVFGSF